MSHDAPEKSAHEIRPQPHGSDGKWKWLAGGAAALAVAAGGYYAYKNFTPTDRADSQYAYNDTYQGNEPLRAEPLTREERENLTAEPASVDEDARPARNTRTASASREPREETVVVNNEPAEAVVGVGLTDVAYNDAVYGGGEDEIVVEGRRHPLWSRSPSAYRLANAYPTYAREQGREGAATVYCAVMESGALGNCVRVEETEPGFGRAALQVARMFQHAPERADGSAAAGTTVNMHVVFKLRDEDNRRRG